MPTISAFSENLGNLKIVFARFTDLQEEIKMECDLRNEAVNTVVQKIARFKYEDGKNIPLAKVRCFT